MIACAVGGSIFEFKKMERESATRALHQLKEIIRALNWRVEEFSEALFSAHIISGRLLCELRHANNYSDSFQMSRKLLEDLMKVVQADLGKMKAILDVVEQFSPGILRTVQRINGRLLFTDYMYAVSIDTN